MSESPVVSRQASVNDNKSENVSVKEDKVVEDKKEVFRSPDILLTEDHFGIYVCDNEEQKYIKRYTWKNLSKVQVQIITYGARVTSIKMPDSKGVVDDVLLGFDNLAGYIYHYNLMLGSIIGRTSNTVELGTFVIDGKQFFVSKNEGKHHKDGGYHGFDQVLWEPYVTESKVILSYTSPHKEEGYPGDLMVRITFELTKDSEFKINMEAFTTRSTIVDLSQLLYFNLGGHWSGPEEIKKHLVNINANCFTLNSEDDGLPTGDIMNVIYSKYDYQHPKLLRDELSAESDRGIEQNLCVNKAKAQDLCFVARVLHPPSGRILELYSNQWGVHFSTAMQFGVGSIAKSVSAVCEEKYSGSLQTQLDLIKKLHQHMKDADVLNVDYDFCELRDLIRRFKKKYVPQNPPATPESGSSIDKFSSVVEVGIKRSDILLTPLQIKYLEEMETLIERIESETRYAEIGQVLRDIVNQAEVIFSEEDECILDTNTTSSKVTNAIDVEDFIMPAQNYDNAGSYTTSLLENGEQKKRTINDIPNHQKDGRIHGKGDAIYTKCCAISFRSQNYPNSIHHPNFPNCILRPGEIYRHSIVYRFMLKGGNPRKWIKRNFPESVKNYGNR